MSGLRQKSGFSRGSGSDAGARLRDRDLGSGSARGAGTPRHDVGRCGDSPAALRLLTADTDEQIQHDGSEDAANSRYRGQGGDSRSTAHLAKLRATSTNLTVSRAASDGCSCMWAPSLPRGADSRPGGGAARQDGLMPAVRRPLGADKHLTACIGPRRGRRAPRGS